MPEELFSGDSTRAQFDICVAIKGSIEEAKARLPQPKGGFTNSRQEAMALAARARAQVIEMEKERGKRQA